MYLLLFVILMWGESSINYCFQTIDAEQFFIANITTAISVPNFKPTLCYVLSLIYRGKHALLIYHQYSV